MEILSSYSILMYSVDKKFSSFEVIYVQAFSPEIWLTMQQRYFS